MCVDHTQSAEHTKHEDFGASMTDNVGTRSVNCLDLEQRSKTRPRCKSGRLIYNRRWRNVRKGEHKRNMSKLCICALCKGRIFLISISSACCNSWTEHGRVIDIYRSSFSEMKGCGTRPESIIHRDFHVLAVVTLDAGEDGD